MTRKHTELFLVDGEPGGTTATEITGWSGHVLSGPRSKLAETVTCPEAQRNGTYFLIGEDESDLGATQCYIGRTENFVACFRSHAAKKDFWHRFSLVRAKDAAFNEGHWGYLETRLAEFHRAAARVSVLNDHAPQGRRHSEAQISDMESFFGQLHIVLRVLGVQAIRARFVKQVEGQPKPERSPTFRSVEPRRGVDAESQAIDGDFFVPAGSRISVEWTAVGNRDSIRRAYAGYGERHEKLIADGSFIVDNGVASVTRDISFTWSSLAGDEVLGRSCNGRKEMVWNSRAYAAWGMRTIRDEASE